MDPNQQPQIQNTGVGQAYPMPPSVGIPQQAPAVGQAQQLPYAAPTAAAPQMPYTPAAAPLPPVLPAPASPAPMPTPTVSSGQPAASGPAKLSPKTNPNSTQNTLQIAEIRDGIVIMNDGSFRSVVMVKSINFDLMSPQEQESVEYAYQGF